MAVVPGYRGSVNAWECDENDHLNVRFHLAKAAQALPFLFAGPSPAVRWQHLRFLREARVATPLAIDAGVVDADAESATVYAEMRHTLSGEVLTTVLTGLAPGAQPPAARCTVPEQGRPRGLGASLDALRPPRSDRAAMGFVEIGRGVISAPECDANGELEPFQYIGRISDSVLNLWAQFLTPEELSRRSHGVEGGVLVELRLAIHAPLRAGSRFTIQSGIAAVGRKTQHLVHLIYDEESGRCAATSQGLAVAMDLASRKSIELPEPRRRRIEARLLHL